MIKHEEAALMKKTENGANDAIEKTAKLLAGAKKVYLATNGSHGHPNLRAISPAKAEGARTVWFAVHADSNKISELVNDNHAVIYFDAPRMGGEFRLWGFVEILDDMESRKKIWGKDYEEFFPDGGIESPSLRVLRFDAVNGTYMNKNMETFPFEF